MFRLQIIFCAVLDKIPKENHRIFLYLKSFKAEGVS